MATETGEAFEITVHYIYEVDGQVYEDCALVVSKKPVAAALPPLLGNIEADLKDEYGQAVRLMAWVIKATVIPTEALSEAAR